MSGRRLAAAARRGQCEAAGWSGCADYASQNTPNSVLKLHYPGRNAFAASRY